MSTTTRRSYAQSEAHCSHRGTSLYYGRNEACGLRCIYHGWKYDAEGRVLDTPAEPPGSKFKDRLQHPAYPCHEVAGIIFAYLGPSDKRPLFPNYRWTLLAPGTSVTKSLLGATTCRGSSSATRRTCRSAPRVRPRDERRDQRLFQQDTAPGHRFEQTDFGVRLIALRRPTTPDLRHIEPGLAQPLLDQPRARSTSTCGRRHSRLATTWA
jgi:nitrite reductase/ring-hydroxylating ferredoxin subunit